jgi:hypothetical protein
MHLKRGVARNAFKRKCGAFLGTWRESADGYGWDRADRMLLSPACLFLYLRLCRVIGKVSITPCERRSRGYASREARGLYSNVSSSRSRRQERQIGLKSFRTTGLMFTDKLAVVYFRIIFYREIDRNARWKLPPGFSLRLRPLSISFCGNTAALIPVKTCGCERACVG